MEKWNDKDIEMYIPIKVKVAEFLDEGRDSYGQIFEDVRIEYVTSCYKVGENSYDIIIPQYPEKDLDNFWSNGIAFVNAKEKDGKYVVGNGGEGSRFLKFKKWKAL